MQFTPAAAFFIVGFLLCALTALLICRKLIASALLSATVRSEAERSVLLSQLDAAQKRSAELLSDASERTSRIEQLQEQRAQEVARRAAAEEQVRRIPELENQLSEEYGKLSSTSARLLEVEKEKAELAIAIQKDREAFAEKVQLVEDAKKQLSGMFAELSSVALQTNNRQFLDLAKQTLQGVQEGA